MSFYFLTLLFLFLVFLEVVLSFLIVFSIVPLLLLVCSLSLLVFCSFLAAGLVLACVPPFAFSLFVISYSLFITFSISLAFPYLSLLCSYLGPSLLFLFLLVVSLLLVFLVSVSLVLLCFSNSVEAEHSVVQTCNLKHYSPYLILLVYKFKSLNLIYKLKLYVIIKFIYILSIVTIIYIIYNMIKEVISYKIKRWVIMSEH